MSARSEQMFSTSEKYHSTPTLRFIAYVCVLSPIQRQSIEYYPAPAAPTTPKKETTLSNRHVRRTRRRSPFADARPRSGKPRGVESVRYHYHRVEFVPLGRCCHCGCTVLVFTWQRSATRFGSFQGKDNDRKPGDESHLPNTTYLSVMRR